MRELLLATGNKGKIPGLMEGLKGAPFTFKTLNDFPELAGLDVEEPGTTYEAHAIIKAFVYGKHTNLLAVADDSGLELDAFPEAMGVQTAHYFEGTRAEKVAQLLALMKDVPTEKRTCRYRDVIAMYDPTTDKVRFAYGVTEGVLATEPLGDGGFGFDQLFISNDLGRAFGEMTVGEIDSVSHRGRALRKAREILAAEFV
jgi:XTP/dITP diphosphohydrolase